jgi:hypothetical protein
MVEFGVRVNYYERLDPDSGERSGYVGSMTKDDFKALVVPRVGEQWMHGIPWFNTADLVRIASVEHGFRPTWVGKDMQSRDAGDPWITVVIDQRAFGPGESEQVIGDFQRNGWQWCT